MSKGRSIDSRCDSKTREKVGWDIFHHLNMRLKIPHLAVLLFCDLQKQVKYYSIVVCNLLSFTWAQFHLCMNCFPFMLRKLKCRCRQISGMKFHSLFNQWSRSVISVYSCARAIVFFSPNLDLKNTCRRALSSLVQSSSPQTPCKRISLWQNSLPLYASASYFFESQLFSLP